MARARDAMAAILPESQRQTAAFEQQWAILQATAEALRGRGGDCGPEKEDGPSLDGARAIFDLAADALCTVNQVSASADAIDQGLKKFYADLSVVLDSQN